VHQEVLMNMKLAGFFFGFSKFIGLGAFALIYYLVGVFNTD
jgi:hypothetical protein